jgi:chromosome segregation ATPase
LLGDVDRLESVLAETRAAHDEELGRLRDEHARARAELDGLQTALAESQASTAEHERRLAEERELHGAERSELNSQRQRLQEELGDALERLAVLGPAAEERDELRAEVERLQATLAETLESSAAELRGVVEERDSLTAELEEARDLLHQAERVRDSQIALEAERDRAVAELEQLQVVATEAQAEAEERTRLLAEEQDRHQTERETLLAQRAVLEQELGSSIEQLAAAAAAADEREAQVQVDSERLLEALDAIRTLAAELVSGSEEILEEPETVETEQDAAVVSDEVSETQEIEYSLFVPGPNGYELVPQTGVPPQAGQRVELVFPDRDEPAVFEVVRSGRTLPGGDVCVYLAQV